MTRPERRRELEAARQAEEAAQADREATCLHWTCDLLQCDWQGRPTLIRCRECNGINSLYHED